jgi:hypothetical protein
VAIGRARERCVIVSERSFSFCAARAISPEAAAVCGMGGLGGGSSSQQEESVNWSVSQRRVACCDRSYGVLPFGSARGCARSEFMKKTAMALVAGVAFGFGASVAIAHPTNVKNNKKAPRAQKVHQEMPAQDDFFDDFESYKDGSDIVGQGGWELWYTGGVSATVSSEQARDTLALRNIVLSDIVQRFTAEDGVWTFSVDTYVPSAPLVVGDGFVILMNQYQTPTDNWSVQVRFDPAFNIVESQFDANISTLIPDQWVNLRCEIDLDNDTLNIYYNDSLFAADLIWSENVSGGGITSIACTDLFSNGIEPMYYDNVTLKSAGGGECAPDLDGNEALDLFDFLAFVNLFNAEDPIADWDNDGEFTLFDFLGFVNSFNAGC